ncbi:MAG: alpha/beta fold hydrolase [Promethearchaeota archaeon]
MSVSTPESVYYKLRKRLDELPIGYPKTESGVEIRILQHLFTPLEAELCFHLSLLPETVSVIFKRTKKFVKTTKELESKLDIMAKNGSIVRSFSRSGKKIYSIIMLAIGMFEFQVDKMSKEFFIDFKQYLDEAFRDEVLKNSPPQFPMTEPPSNYRLHSTPPFTLVVLHGGPGAWGEMAPVAQRLSDTWGIIEAFQTRPNLEGQLAEIRELIEKFATGSVTLIGFSWGAWLAYLFAATPFGQKRIGKVILIGSGPYEHEYYLELIKTRENRMNPAQKERYSEILKSLQDPQIAKKDDINDIISQLGALCGKVDQFDEIGGHDELFDEEAVEETFPVPLFDFDRSTHFQQALNEVFGMRQSGDLLKEAEKIKCPVVAIHGDYDPHPANGVKLPLEKNIRNFQFFLLEKCGHKPWTEKHARSKFFQRLRSVLP